MRRNIPYAALILTLSATNVAFASGDPDRGKEKSTVCAACHNADGNSVVPTFPRLAGQNEDYIVHALASYKNGTRKNEVMKGMVATLTKQDMEDLAAYFSSQQGLFVKK
ncbi:MAG TPA: cytochrome c [Rhodocyclaceae bacterium]|nr:cytochrome c [Rhodocyclaceae bacterium]